MKMTLESLRQVPYLDAASVGNRDVPLMPYWDGTRWSLWIPSPNGLMEMHPADAAETDYVAKQPAGTSDIVIPFVELMWQRASWPEVCPLIKSISADFHNLGTSVEKLWHFYRNRDAVGVGAAAHFAKTELEYTFMLARSVFDLLQEVVVILWSTKVNLLDPASEARRKASKLPSTFSKMILRDKKDIRAPEELVEKYALPDSVARAYIQAAPFFSSVRRFRDSVVHSGKDVRLIYVTDKGFCLHKGVDGFDAFPCWKEHHSFNEHTVSMLPVIAHVVLETIDTCSNVMTAIASQIRLPPEVAPGYRIFVRGPHNDALVWMLDVARGGSPWCSDRPLPKSTPVPPDD